MKVNQCLWPWFPSPIKHTLQSFHTSFFPLDSLLHDHGVTVASDDFETRLAKELDFNFDDELKIDDGLVGMSEIDDVEIEAAIRQELGI